MAYPPSTPIHGVLTNTSPANTGGTGGEHVDYHNDAAAAITDIVAELGDDPKGDDADVSNRLDRIELDTSTERRPEDQGYLTWTYPSVFAGLNSAITTAGTLYLVGLVLNPVAVTGFQVIVATPGSGLTHALYGLYDAAGVRVATSAENTTAHQSAAVVQTNLTAPYTPPARALYRVGFFFTGTTPPSLARASSGLGSNANVGTAYLHATANTGITALPSTHGAMTALNNAYWIGVV